MGNAGLGKAKKSKNIISISIMVFMVNLLGANWRVAALPCPAPRSCCPCIQPGLTQDVGLPSPPPCRQEVADTFSPFLLVW